MLYHQSLPEIYTIDSNEIESEFGSDSIQNEWCPNQSELPEVEVGEVAAVLEEFVQSARPRGNVNPEREKVLNAKSQKWSNRLKGLHENVPDTLPGIQAVQWNGRLNADLRPHLWDPQLQKFLLVDSGSQITAIPPEPGDKASNSSFLRAVNGSRIKTFGYKDITIKIGRKAYDFRAIKADIANPVLGWDFMRHHRLELVWNDWGDNCIYDKRLKQLLPLLTNHSQFINRTR